MNAVVYRDRNIVLSKMAKKTLKPILGRLTCLTLNMRRSRIAMHAFHTRISLEPVSPSGEPDRNMLLYQVSQMASTNLCS